MAAHLRAVLAPHVTAQVRGSVSSSACEPHRVQRSGACRNRGTALRDSGSPHSTRPPMSVTAAQVHGSPTSACSTPPPPTYRLPCRLPWRALWPHERMRRKSNAGIWWTSDMIAPKAAYGKPLGFARVACGTTGRRGLNASFVRCTGIATSTTSAFTSVTNKHTFTRKGRAVCVVLPLGTQEEAATAAQCGSLRPWRTC